MRNLTDVVIDFSLYQRKIDVPFLRKERVRAGIGKSSQGIHQDPLFEPHYKNFIDNEMPIAAYHWVDPIYSPQRNMENFLLATKGSNPFAYFVDMEQWWSNWGNWYDALRGKLYWSLVPKFDKNRLSDHYESCMEYLSLRAEAPVVAYTSWGHVVSYAPGMAQFLGKYLGWPASYIFHGQSTITITWETLHKNYKPVGRMPMLPPGMKTENVVGWQYTGDYLKLPGIHSDDAGRHLSATDVSIFDSKWLDEVTGEKVLDPVISPPPEIPSPSFPTYYRVKDWVTRGLALRKTPSSSVKAWTVMKAGSIVTFLDKEEGDWLYVRYKDFAGWAHRAYLELTL